MLFLLVFIIPVEAAWNDPYQCQTGNCTIRVRTVNATSGAAINQQICNITFYRDNVHFLNDTMQNETDGFQMYDFNATEVGDYTYAILCIFDSEVQTDGGIMEVTGVTGSLTFLLPLIIAIGLIILAFKQKEADGFMHMALLFTGFGLVFGAIFIARAENPALATQIDILYVPVFFLFMLIFGRYGKTVLENVLSEYFGIGRKKKYGI